MLGIKWFKIGSCHQRVANLEKSEIMSITFIHYQIFTGHLLFIGYYTVIGTGVTKMNKIYDSYCSETVRDDRHVKNLQLTCYKRNINVPRTTKGTWYIK